MFLSSSRRYISTHIQGLGHALFQLRDHKLELRSFSAEEFSVDTHWVTKTGLIAEGLTQQAYLHLDIRTPFGETVENTQVENALAESLGPRKEKFRLGQWHIQFVEDTNLGSNHRIFVDLIENKGINHSFPGMDMGLPLELAIEALGEMAMTESGQTNFQLLYGGSEFCYSLLFLNGSAFHILKVNEPASAKAATRLKQHREFLLSQGKLVGNTLKTFLVQEDPLEKWDLIQDLKPQYLNLGLSQDSIKAAAAHGKGSALLLHLGLAYATRQKDLFLHNRVALSDQAQNYTIRSRHRFNRLMAATVILGVCIALGYGIAILSGKKKMENLHLAAAQYQVQVDAIRSLRREKTKLELALQDLRPVWNVPVNWSKVFIGLTAALPEESGIDGLSVVKTPEGKLELSFRAWVRDWGQVQGIQKKLLARPPFSAVTLSEQRKDLSSGVVIFHVTCQLDRNDG